MTDLTLVAAGLITVFSIAADYASGHGSLLRGQASVRSMLTLGNATLLVPGVMLLYVQEDAGAASLLSISSLGFVPVIIYWVHLNKQWYPSVLDTRIPIFTWAIVMAGTVAVLILILSQGIPLVKLILGASPADTRASRNSLLWGTSYAVAIRPLLVFPQLAAFLMIARAAYRTTLKSIAAAFLFSLVAFILLVASTERMPAMAFLISSAIVVGWISPRFSPGTTITVALVVSAGVGLVLTGAVFDDQEDSSYEILFSRIIAAQARGPVAALENFNEPADYLGGKSYHVPSSIFGSRHDLDSELFSEIYGPGSIGRAPPGAFANAVVNFGWLWGFIEYVLLLSILMAIDRKLAARRDLVALAARAWLIVFSLQIIFAGSSTAVIAHPSLLFVLAVVGAKPGGKRANRM